MKGSNLPFQGTVEQERQLRDKLAELKPQGGALMPALQYAQELYGYLPYEVQKIIAEVIKRYLIRRLRRGDVLFAVFAVSQGKVSNRYLLGHCVLCQRLGRNLR